MEMTRKEILNSSEYWQERAETQCYIEGIGKDEMIKEFHKAMKGGEE